MDEATKAAVERVRAAADDMIARNFSWQGVTGEDLRLVLAAAQRTATVPEGWRDMDTAPKDGSRVMLLLPERKYWERAIFGSWRTDEHAKHPRPYWTHDQERICGTLDTRRYQPVAWQPVPAAPKPGEPTNG